MPAHRFSHPLRALLFVLLLGLGASNVAWAAPEGAAADSSPQTRIEQASRAVAAVKRAVTDADAPETLKTLAERASQAQREAEASVAALQPELTQLDARIEQLGPAPEGGEDSGIARQRQRGRPGPYGLHGNGDVWEHAGGLC